MATIFNGQTSVNVYDAMGKLVAEYGQPISNSGIQYVFTDHQGSTRVITNGSGAVVSRHDYQPFGGEIGSIGMRSSTPEYSQADIVRQKHAGMEQDEGSNLSHTLWRQQDYLSGRWTSPDPYGGSMTTADPQSFNRYTYVNNDPVNHVDPLGLMLSDIGVVQTTDAGYAHSLEMKSLSDLQLSVNADYAMRHNLVVNETRNGDMLHFTAQQNTVLSPTGSITTLNPGEIAFDGYFDGEGILTWWYHLSYTLPTANAGTSCADPNTDADVPVQTTRPAEENQPSYSSRVVCIFGFCGGFTRNSNGKVLLNIGYSIGPPRFSYTHSSGKGYQGSNLSISAYTWWPFEEGAPIIGYNQTILGSGSSGFSGSRGTPQAGIQGMMTLDLPPTAGLSAIGFTSRFR